MEEEAKRLIEEHQKEVEEAARKAQEAVEKHVAEIRRAAEEAEQIAAKEASRLAAEVHRKAMEAKNVYNEIRVRDELLVELGLCAENIISILTNDKLEEVYE